MKNNKEEKSKKEKNRKSNRICLVKKIDIKGSVLPVINTSCNNFPSDYPMTSRLTKNKNNKLPPNLNYISQSSRIKGTSIVENNKNNNKGNSNISSYLNKNMIKNQKKIISTFCVEDEKISLNKSALNKTIYKLSKKDNNKNN